MGVITIITKSQGEGRAKHSPFLIMKLKIYLIVFMLVVISIVQSASAHKVGMSYTEIVIYPKECIFTITFDEKDMLDPEFLSALELSLQGNERDSIQHLKSAATKIITLSDREMDARVVSMEVQKRKSKVSLVIRMQANKNAINNIHFPILDQFAHGHRQVVTVWRNATLAGQHLVHAGKQSIALSDEI